MGRHATSSPPRCARRYRSVQVWVIEGAPMNRGIHRGRPGQGLPADIFEEKLDSYQADNECPESDRLRKTVGPSECASTARQDMTTSQKRFSGFTSTGRNSIRPGRFVLMISGSDDRRIHFRLPRMMSSGRGE
jgi:hypothetical protein